MKLQEIDSFYRSYGQYLKNYHYPSLQYLSDTNKALNNLNLNLPYHTLKNMPEYIKYNEFLSLINFYRPLTEQIRNSYFLNNISLDNPSLKKWLEILKEDETIKSSFISFKLSELGEDLLNELKFNPEADPYFDNNDLLFLIFVFIFFSISLYGYHNLDLFREFVDKTIFSNPDGTFDVLKDLLDILEKLEEYNLPPLNQFLNIKLMMK